MIIIGHRGAMGYEPENTLSSFAKALELGVEGVELDVRLCKTGELVVIHDARLRRITKSSGYVKDTTLADLKKFDAGKGQTIPTLEEVVDFIEKRCMINIELKDEGVAEPVADIIRSFIKRGWETSHFMISSFDHHELKRFHEGMPQVPFAPLIAAKPIDYACFAQTMKAHAVNPAADFVDWVFVKDAHQRGLKIIVWTVNNPDDIKKMIDMGVDGIISDYPDRVRSILTDADAK
ncbi:MAG: hypothetical protein JW925_13010 [Syntrophaceae bacterium]|nr:hypothetical protein [Syntrophaceae bacterium]